jgi:DNA polymerase III sliding clamp (beta) subunit (PCNA family)
MKFSIERKLLLDVLSVGGSMSGKSKVLPILDSCKVVISNGRIIISSYDGENAVLKCCSVTDHDVDMSFCVNCSDFIKSVKSVKDAILDFVLVEEAKILSINHLRGFMELPYESSDEFPTIDNVTDGVSMNMECSVLWNWLNRARNFVANDTLRPILCGVNFYELE